MAFSELRFVTALESVQSCGALVTSPYTIALHPYETLVSTNQTAWDWVDQQAIAPLSTTPVILALQQSAGRGQRGKQWLSLPGGLYLSIVLTPHIDATQAIQLTLCAAWGIAIALRTIPSALSGVTASIPVQIKWLNDLVIHGRKLGGILTETRIRQGQVSHAVVGVGINWANPVPPIGINLQSLQPPVPVIPSLEWLAAMVTHGLIAGYQQWQRDGIASLLSGYVELMAYRDRAITLSDGQTGTIVGITAAGELCIQLASAVPGMDVATKRIPPGTLELGYVTAPASSPESRSATRP